jgi:hypothetical protein
MASLETGTPTGFFPLAVSLPLALARGPQGTVGAPNALPSPKLGPRWALVSKIAELWRLEGTLLALSTKRGRGVC